MLAKNVKDDRIIIYNRHQHSLILIKREYTSRAIRGSSSIMCGRWPDPTPVAAPVATQNIKPTLGKESEISKKSSAVLYYYFL